MKLINYPAMASPHSMSIINDFVEKRLPIGSAVLDPFCGTGRLLFGPRNKGHDVTGIDCSPVAILAARVSHQRNNLEKISHDLEVISKKIATYAKQYFPTPDELFWFPRKAFSDLRTILSCVDKFATSSHTRRFFWLALARTARAASYIREEEYKAHRISSKRRSSFRPKPHAMFIESCLRMLARLNDPPTQGVGHYRFIQDDVINVLQKQKKFDAVITSPPYGDSISTVAYGQFAKIPLEVLKYSEHFCMEFEAKRIGGSLDTYCLGGSNCKPDAASSLVLPESVHYLPTGPMQKFCTDYFQRLGRVSELLKDSSICAFVLANRTYRGKEFPLITSTISFMEKYGFELVNKQDRFLTWKRLPRSMQRVYDGSVLRHSGMNYESVVMMYRSI